MVTGNVRRLRAVPDVGELPPVRTRTIHGYERAYRIAGEGPPVLLLHGIGDSSETWREVLPDLARDHLVIAPDLLGHGASDKPRGDYSVGGFANGVRDLLSVLGIDRVTVVGHSLGAGVAMQFAYQYPYRCDRLVLVSAGGVCREVHPALRALSMPGTAAALSLLKLAPLRWQLRAGVGILEHLDTAVGADAQDLLRIVSGLPDQQARAAFVRALRAVVDVEGQIVTMLDRCYLAHGMPTLLVWGARDAVVPLRHAHLAQSAMPGSVLEVFEDAGHFPFRADPARFLDILRRFVGDTAAADWSVERWRSLLRQGRPEHEPQAVGSDGC